MTTSRERQYELQVCIFVLSALVAVERTPVGAVVEIHAVVVDAGPMPQADPLPEEHAEARRRRGEGAAAA